MEKQIFAALEVADHEIRLIVGEFFNTRFNIIKVERIVNHESPFGKEDSVQSTVEAIKKAVDNASRTIGAKIERVILCIPSFNVKRYPLQVTVSIDSINREVTLMDIQKAMVQARRQPMDEQLALVQTVCVKYTCNGISTRRLPLNEKCDEMIVDIDLLAADKKMTFNLVSIIEQSGLEIIDVYLDSFAIAKEAALFEQTINQNVIVLKLERNSTTLGLLAKGKLMNTEMLPLGFGHWIDEVGEHYELSLDTIARLIKYNVKLNNDEPSDMPIYIWAQQGETFTLSEKTILDIINNKVAKWIDDIKMCCQPILAAGKTMVVITGEGGELQGLAERLNKSLEVDVRNYCPETLGVRDSSLTACVGLFFAYKDQLPILMEVNNSVNIEQFEKTVTYKDKTSETTSDDESITQKLRSMLFEVKK